MNGLQLARRFPCLFRLENWKKQARKGFRPPSAMKGIGYFQNLRKKIEKFFGNFSDFFGNFLGIF